MRLIAWDLKKYAALKPVVDSLRVENGLLYRQKSLMERTVTTQDSLLAQHERARGLQGLLQTSAQHERDQWKARAKARWWTSLGLGAVALLLGAAAVQ